VVKDFPREIRVDSSPEMAGGQVHRLENSSQGLVPDGNFGILVAD
jgi:hypothetical protein